MSDGDATASTFGVPPLEDPALRTYLPWEVVYHSVAGPSEHEVSRQLVLDPLTGFFRECNLTGPLSRIWVLDQGAKLVGECVCRALIPIPHPCFACALVARARLGLALSGNPEPAEVPSRKSKAASFLFSRSRSSRFASAGF